MEATGVKFQVPFECTIVGVQVGDHYVPLDPCVISPGDFADLRIEPIKDDSGGNYMVKRGIMNVVLMYNVSAKTFRNFS